MKHNKLTTLDKYKPLPQAVNDFKIEYYETVFVDEELLADAIEFYNEFFGYRLNPIDRRLALNMAELGPRLNADFWRCIRPRTEEQMDVFYQITPFYFFHDVMRFMDGIHRNQMQEIIDEDYDDILDFAGGAGGASLILNKAGRRVSYWDSSAISRHWMKWLVEKYKLGITVLDKAPEAGCKAYGFIVAKDIAEHVLDPGKLLNYLTSMLKEGGKMVVTQYPCCGPEEFAPMHFKIDLVDGKIRYSPKENLESLNRLTLP